MSRSRAQRDRRAQAGKLLSRGCSPVAVNAFGWYNDVNEEWDEAGRERLRSDGAIREYAFKIAPKKQSLTARAFIAITLTPARSEKRGVGID